MNKGRYFKIILTVCGVMISAPMAFAQKFFNDNELLLEFSGGHSAAFGHFAAVLITLGLRRLRKLETSISILNLVFLFFPLPESTKCI